MKFQERLKELRKTSNISQKTLADELGLSQQAIGKWEMGTASPTPDMLIKIANFFDVSLDYLLCQSGFKSPQTADVKDQELLKLCSRIGVLEKEDKENLLTVLLKLLEIDHVNESGLGANLILKCCIELLNYMCELSDHYYGRLQMDVMGASNLPDDYFISNLDSENKEPSELNKARDTINKIRQLYRIRHLLPFSITVKSVVDKISNSINLLIENIQKQLDEQSSMIEEIYKSYSMFQKSTEALCGGVKNAEKENKTQCPRCGYDTPKG